VIDLVFLASVSRATTVTTKKVVNYFVLNPPYFPLEASLFIAPWLISLIVILTESASTRISWQQVMLRSSHTENSTAVKSGLLSCKLSASTNSGMWQHK